MTSLAWQFVTVTPVVRAPVELAAAKQSNPLTKLAVTIPPPSTVAVTGLALADGENVMEAEFDVQEMKVKPEFDVAATEMVEPKLSHPVFPDGLVVPPVNGEGERVT